MSASEDFTCQELVELVTDYLEGSLTPDERRAFEEHLQICEGCVNYVDQMREAIRLTGQLTPESLSPEVQAELLEAFRGLKRR